MINDKVFIHTLVVALSCVPTALLVGLTINKIGKKIMLGECDNFSLCNLLILKSIKFENLKIMTLREN